MNKLLGQYELFPLMNNGVSTLKKIYVYDDRLELEYWTPNTSKEDNQNRLKLTLNVKKSLKKYAYEDLTLMNEVMNKIWGRPCERKQEDKK